MLMQHKIGIHVQISLPSVHSNMNTIKPKSTNININPMGLIFQYDFCWYFIMHTLKLDNILTILVHACAHWVLCSFICKSLFGCN